jgi:inositol oxygenase
MNEKDRRMFEWVQTFNAYDLYTKSHDRPDVIQSRPFYEELIREYFPERLKW